MDSYRRLLTENRRWVEARLGERPDYFTRLTSAQRPDYLWIGCSDSRVPAETVTGCQPGELFVHRNIANVVVHTDLNLFSVLHFAVDELKVNHVIVCGHYGCGGVKAAMSHHSYGLIIDKWLRDVKEVYAQHAPSLEAIPDPELRARRLVELNVVQQVRDVAKTAVIQSAWKREQRPWLHGWVYDMDTGLLKELTLLKPEDLPDDIFRYDVE
ncbi:MAG: carbonic anhydrase [Anaeromyxobacter sp.]